MKWGIVTGMLVLALATAAVAAGWLKLATAPSVKAGIEQSELVATLGDPASRSTPIGNPAVERWQYADGTQVVLLGGRVVDAFFEVK